jgi:hypothetical protein
VQEGEQGRNGEDRHYHRYPHAPNDVTGLHAVHKGRVEDPGRQMEAEPAALDNAPFRARMSTLLYRGKILRPPENSAPQTIVFRNKEIGDKLCGKHRKKNYVPV